MVSVCLTGCGFGKKPGLLDSISDKISEWQQNREIEKAEKRAVEDYKTAKKEQEEAEKEADRNSLYSDEYSSIVDSSYENAGWLSKTRAKLRATFSGETPQEAWAAQHQDAVDSKVHKKANDKRLKEAEKAEKEAKEESKADKEAFRKALPLVLIFGVILVLVILFIVLSKRSVEKPVKVKVVQNKSAPAPAPTTQGLSLIHI